MGKSIRQIWVKHIRIAFSKTQMYLRNEFHFSGVHGAMNRSGSRAKLMNPEGVHVSFAMNRSGSRAKLMNPEGVHVSFASDPLRFIAP